jgi:hypothetical protein
VGKKKRREEGVEEGVFIDGRRPVNGRLGSYNIDIDVTRLTPTGGSSVLPVLSRPSCYPMLSILPHRLIGPLVGTEEY